MDINYPLQWMDMNYPLQWMECGTLMHMDKETCTGSCAAQTVQQDRLPKQYLDVMDEHK